jgi:hypothetical protein
MGRVTDLKAHYAALPDDELRNIATTTELEPEASQALQQELQRRSITDLDAYAQQMKDEKAAEVQQEQDRLDARGSRLRVYGRLGYAACAIVAVVGVVQYFVSGDSTNGLVTIAIAVIGVPFVWLNVWVRLMFVRLQRRAWQRSLSRPTTRSSGRSPANAGSRR